MSAPPPAGSGGGPGAARSARRAPTPEGARLAWRIGPFVLRPFWKVRLHGAQHVPARGAVILAGNHAGFLDGPLIVGLSPRPVHFMVKREMFRGVVGAALGRLGQISVDRTGADRAAVLDALAVLAEGGVLGVFPEGTRSAGDFATMHNGLAYFALRSGAPVVPVACLGSAERGSSATALPALRSRIDLVFGPPVQLGRGAGRTAVDAASARLREVLQAHLEQARVLTGRAAAGSAAGDAVGGVGGDESGEAVAALGGGAPDGD